MTKVASKQAVKQKSKDRGFTSYFPKLCKKHKIGARGEVHAELEKMFYFALESVVNCSNTILTEYAQKEDTVKPKIIQGALSTLMWGELKTGAMSAGAAAELARVQKAKMVAKKSEEGGAGEAEAVEAA